MKQTMKQSHSHPARLLVAACTLLMILSVAPAGFAQQANQAQTQPKPQVASAPSTAAAASPVASTPAAKPAGEEKEAAAPSKPGNEGIRIHGHWVLQVKNPDGSLGERREFDNSLTNGSGISGTQLLVGLLGGDLVAGGLGVAFIQGPTTTTATDPTVYCNNNFGIPPSGISCFMLYNSSATIYTDGPFFALPANGQSGLTETDNITNPGPSVSIVLSGNFTVLSSYNLTTINAVSTYEAVCGQGGGTPAQVAYGTSPQWLAGFTNNNIPPSTCATFTPGSGRDAWIVALTSTNVSPPLSVVTSQVITVTVTLSFS
jgi:hypothetical protein